MTRARPTPAQKAPATGKRVSSRSAAGKGKKPGNGKGAPLPSGWGPATQAAIEGAPQAPRATARSAAGDVPASRRGPTSTSPSQSKKAGGGPGAMVRAWTDTMEWLTSANMRFFSQYWMKALKPTGLRHLDAMAFGQFGRLAGLRWSERLKKATKRQEEGGGDDQETVRLKSMWSGMVAEYRRDLSALQPDSFLVDFVPLTEAWHKSNSEAIDDSAVKVVERFLAALVVKSRYGPEYYADPVLTEVGQTPREVVHQVGRAKLYRYLPTEGTKRADAPPVLLVYSVINKAYILDLLPGYSFIEHLLAEGLDVYLIEWGATQAGDRTTTLDSYIDPVMRSCVDAMRARTGDDKVSLFGHCIGGVLAAMYAALYPDDVHHLITLTTPFSAPEGGVVGMWTDPTVFPLDAILETYGHVPGKLIRYTFIGLKPYYEMVKWKTFVENLTNEDAMRLFYPIDKWANDNVDIPGEVFRKFVDEVYHKESIRRGNTTINGRKVKLGNITSPVMNLLATADWIVPPASAEIFNDLVGSRDRRLVKIDGAHVAIMIDPRTRPVWTQMSDFLLEA